MPAPELHDAVLRWYDENARVLVNMDESRRRLQYLRDDPRVSITVLGKEQWYRQVTLRRGRHRRNCHSAVQLRVPVD